MAFDLDALIAEKLGQQPQDQPTPLAQPQAPAALPPAPQGPRIIQAPQDWVAGQKIPGQGPSLPFYQKPTYINRQEEHNGKFYDVRQEPVSGAMDVLGEHAKEPSEKEKPSYEQTRREVRATAEQLLRIIEHRGSYIDGQTQAELWSKKNTWAHPDIARAVTDWLPSSVVNGIKSIGGPAGAPDPVMGMYAGKIGQVKTKLLSVYSQGRQSIWMTKFMAEHLPNENFPTAANKDRLLSLLAGGMLDRAVAEASREEKGQFHYTPEDTAKMEVYEQQGLSPEEAYNQVVYDRVVFGDKAKDTTQGWVIK